MLTAEQSKPIDKIIHSLKSKTKSKIHKFICKHLSYKYARMKADKLEHTTRYKRLKEKFENLSLEILKAKKQFQNKIVRERELMAKSLIKELFPVKTVLYVGASFNRWHLVDMIKSKNPGVKITLVEAFASNVEYFRKKNTKIFSSVEHSDIVEYVKNNFQPNAFDLVVWWHGPEHVAMENLESTLNALYRMSKKGILIGCPYGLSAQHEMYGNDYEKHLTTLCGGDLKNFNYTKILKHMKKDGPFSSIIAARYKKEAI